MNSAFGTTLGDIGGDIANVVAKDFQQMTTAVIGGVFKSMAQHPVETFTTGASILLPLVPVLGATTIAITKLNKAFTEKTFGQRIME